VRPFTRDVEDDLPFDDDEWDLDHGDGESETDDLPEDDWEARPTSSPDR
jgi:hypothetical protein